MPSCCYFPICCAQPHTASTSFPYTTLFRSIEWHAIPLADESIGALTIQRPHELVRRLMPDMTQQVPDLEPMRVDTFVEWLQQWIETEINERLRDFGQHSLNRIEESVRAQTVVINQMYRYMVDAVSTLRQYVTEQASHVEDGEMDWEATGPAVTLALPDVEGLVDTYIQQDQFHWKRDQTAPPPGPPTDMPRGQPRLGQQNGPPDPRPPTN